jgi:thioredoxin reductase (NADPH)
MGPELMQVFKGQAERFGTTIKTEIIDSIENIDGGFKLKSSKGEYEFKTVIIASGASARMARGLMAKKNFKDMEFLHVLLVTASFSKRKKWLLLVVETLQWKRLYFLTKFAKKVYVIHRRDQFRASQIMQDRVLNHEKIEGCME